MLFQRLYNWIKYKTLPSSFLFKNRLFIERDSKHRRVMSNFGLSFRNSKWTNYETYNIKSVFRTNYFKFIFSIFFIIFLLVFFTNFNKYYIFSYAFNTVSFFAWIGLDTIDYYLSFFVWVLTISFSFFFNLIYSYFFFNNFSSSNSNNFSPSTHDSRNFSKPSSFTFKNINVSKHDLNWVLYSWLTNPKKLNNSNNAIIEKLFESNVNSSLWNKNYDFFIKLYKLSYYLNKVNSINIYKLNSNLSIFENNFFKGDYFGLIYFFNNNSILNKFSPLLLHYFLKNYKNYFNTKLNKTSSTSFLNNKNTWNLFNFNNELTNLPFLLKNKNGIFYLDDFNYQQLNNLIFNFNELWPLNTAIKNQLTSAKWNRWLYRYSILHRKILKNSHKITLSKKLINSGFYESKIFNKNIWANEHLNKITSPESFSSIFNLYYSNLFQKGSLNYNNYKFYINNNNSQLETLNLLNFYENSYFWYLKRFYNFNTTFNNNIKSKMSLNLYLNKTNYISSNSNYDNFISYLLNSSYLNLNNLSHSNNINSVLNNLFISSNFNNSNEIYNIKDFYLIFSENDFLTKDNLNILYWITTSQLNKNSINFYNILSFSNLNNFKYSNDFLNNSSSYNNFSYWYSFSLINFDKFFLKDAIYLSLFLN